MPLYRFTLNGGESTVDVPGDMPLLWVLRETLGHTGTKDSCGIAQCGSGQIMAAAALLARNPDPSDVDIDDAMSGNLCRCGTYNRIRAAIHAAADEARP